MSDIAISAIIIYLFLIILLFITVIFQMIVFPKILRKKTYALENQLDVEGYLKFMNKLLKRLMSRRLRLISNIDKAACYGLLGNFNEALLIMKKIKNQIDSNKDMNLRIIYYSNYLSLLLDSQRFSDAKEFYKTNKEKLLSRTENKRVNEIADNALAQYNIEFGNANEAKKMFLNKIKSTIPLLRRLGYEYYIGLADIKLRNKSEAIVRFKRIYPDAKNIFIGKNISQMLP